MRLNAKVSEDGTLVAHAPKSLRGKSVVISIQEKNKDSNLDGILSALQHADTIKVRKRNHKEILKDLRDFKERK